MSGKLVERFLGLKKSLRLNSTIVLTLELYYQHHWYVLASNWFEGTQQKTLLQYIIRALAHLTNVKIIVGFLRPLTVFNME